MSVTPPLTIGPGDDDPTPQPGVALSTVDTPDPYGTADAGSYSGRGSGQDVAIDFLPPWSKMRAPGTVPSIVPDQIVPLNPWKPVLAVLNANQMAALNRESAARQMAAMMISDYNQQI
jgi:hypothetical protein